MKKIRVWDLPVRLFHWLLVALIAVAMITQEIGVNAMVWHFRAGYAVLTLMAFRLIWGICGTYYARFSSFLHRPSAIISYLRGNQDKGELFHGHNPLGSLSVLAMLAVILLQAVSGLFANDDIFNEGPLVKFISKELSDKITWFHTEVNAWALYALIALHIAAVAYYYIVKRQNLIKPMITGDKEGASNAPAADDSLRLRLLAAGVLLLCAAAVYLLVNLKP